MPAPLSCDIAIVGGGLAGGLIALALARQRPELDERIVERSDRFGGNHLWSFFASDILDADRWIVAPLVSYRWQGYDIAFPAHRRTLDGAYYSIESERLDATLRAELPGSWDARVAEAAGDVVQLLTGVMSGAAEAEPGLPYHDGTVIDHIRVTRDVSMIRLQLDHPLDYHPGLYLTVQVPQWPRRWRCLSPSIPADPGGAIEFHVRSVSGGMVSTAIVGETRPGDRWRLSNPHGALHVDRDGGDVLMVAGSTGLAPLRALIMDLCRYGVNPRVHLFFGGRFPCDLYDLRTLWEIASTNPWLSVTPVSEFATDPPWAADYPDVQPPRGLHVRQNGLLPAVVTRYGGWSDRQILVCGGPGMVTATKAALIAKGAPPERIQHDPLH